MLHTRSKLCAQNKMVFWNRTQTHVPTVLQKFARLLCFCTLCITYTKLFRIWPLCYMITRTDDDVLKTPKRICRVTGIDSSV